MDFLKYFSVFFLFTIPSAHADHYVSFAIKGGISLGSYEAGLNWVFIEEIRRKELELNTFAGASAGGINAIVSAVRTCQIKDSPDIENNIFRNAWSINIDEIAPIEGQAEFDYTDIIDNFDEYIKGDDNVKGTDKGGLFTRKGLLNSVKLVYNEIRNKKYKKGCEVNIGLSVTKFFPEEIFINGVGLKNQRFIFPLKLSVEKDIVTSKNKVVFKNFYANEADFFKNDNYLYLPENNDKNVSVFEVLKLALATSAFPVAFAPVNLHYCKFEKDVKKIDQRNCPENYIKRHDLFLDGGSFDNAPIGSALAMTEYSLKNKQHNKKTVSYGYINPGHMREPGKNIHTDSGKKFEGKANEYIAGITDYVDTALNIMDYGMTAEFGKALRRYEDSDTTNRLYITSRFYPLVGDYLSHFGAFFDDSFRDFDFHVGVYDGVINTARYRCLFPESKHDDEQDSQTKKPTETNSDVSADFFYSDETKKCIGEKSQKIYEYLDVAAGDGNDIFAALAKREFASSIMRDEWKWLDVDKILQKNKNSKNIDIFMALDDSDCLVTSLCINDVQPASFKQFLANIDKENQDYNALTKKIAAKPDDWFFPMLASTIDRQYNVEQIKYEYLKDKEKFGLADDQEFFLKTLKAVGLVARTVAMRREQGYWPASTVIKPKWMRLVPDEVGGDLRNGGVYFAYNHITQLGSGSPYVLETSFIPFHDLNNNIYPSENSSLDLTLRYHKISPAFSSVGIGVIGYADWHKQSDVSRYSYGFTTDVGMLGDKIRVSLLYRRIDDLDESQYSLLFGITDFKGFSNWLFN